MRLPGHTHFITRCECGRVLEQCRCIGPKQDFTRSPCACPPPSGRELFEELAVDLGLSEDVLYRRLIREAGYDRRRGEPPTKRRGAFAICLDYIDEFREMCHSDASGAFDALRSAVEFEMGKVAGAAKGE